MRWRTPGRTRRPSVSIETLLVLVCAYFIVVCNGAFWRALLSGRDWWTGATWHLIAAMLIAVVGLHFAVLAAVMTRHTAKPLLILLSVATALAAVFMQTYTVYLDPTMMGSVLRTDWPEARELVGIGTFAKTLVYALPPIALISWIQLRQHSITRTLVMRLGTITAALGISALALLSVMQDVAPLMRVQREVRYLITPGNFLYSSYRHLSRTLTAAPIGRLHAQARQEPRSSAAAKRQPILFVLVVGETARGANFSLNGYAQPTNPQLQSMNVVSFPNVTSCGTATEISLPCMFSPFGRREFDADEQPSHDGLLQVLAHSGYAVTWRDNQSGCKGVCDGDGIQLQHTREWAVPQKCSDGRCLDEVLLDNLDQFTTGNADRVIVLHQLGNHGPAYYKRYPPEFRRFAPTCDTSELRECTREQIVNTYDNAILYTDALLARVIDFLRTQEPRYDTAMLYLADHGESLGERGMYLHGMPYAIAPRDQIQVPMILWASPEFERQTQVQMTCVRHRAALPASHDNLFHSVLGLLSVHTQAYRQDRDLFAACRPPARLGQPTASDPLVLQLNEQPGHE